VKLLGLKVSWPLGWFGNRPRSRGSSGITRAV